jgi:protein-L-isoaspartate(D-aspartate) O-methyltransferase
MEYQHMSALDASQDREGHEIDSGGRSESDDEFDQDSVAIGNLAAAARAKLADQLLASGRADAAVEAAFRGVPRHTFLPEMDPVEAYQDRAVVIKSDSEGLPVSASTQPTMMAVMLSQLGLAAGHRVLEIGTGTGYNAALIARIVGDQKSVVTIDVVPDLIGQARVNLTAAGYGRVTVVCGDGYQPTKFSSGWHRTTTNERGYATRGDHDARSIRRPPSAHPGCGCAVAARSRCTATGICTRRDTRSHGAADSPPAAHRWPTDATFRDPCQLLRPVCGGDRR